MSLKELYDKKTKIMKIFVEVGEEETDIQIILIPEDRLMLKRKKEKVD